MLERWKQEGALVEDGEPAIWALTQDYTAPDGREMTRRGFLARVRLAEYGEGVRPHERTQPGPKEDRLRLTRATKHNLSPIFSLYPGDAWPAIEPATAGEPWGEFADAEGTTHRVWRVADPGVHEAIANELAEGELLIADGHHRYETSMAYARETGELGTGGAADYVLMALVSLEDPGLTVFATHRLLKDLNDEQRERIRDAAKAGFELREVGEDELVPDDGDPPGSFGYMDAHHLQPWRLSPKDPQLLETALAEQLGGLPPARRGGAGAALPQGRGRPEPRGHRRQEAARLHAERGGGRGEAEGRRMRRRLLPAPDPRRAGARGGGRGRNDAPEVHLLLPQGRDGDRLQPL